jgi:hypothetical protein
MSAGSQSGKKTTTPRQTLSLSEQTHLQILDYFRVASENSEHPAIRDAAILLATEKSRYQQKQGARLSPTLTMVIAVLILVSAGLASWYFFVTYTEHVASILSVIAIGLALIGVCLLAMFAGQLSQAHFVSIVRMVWSRISGIFPRSSQASALPDQIIAEQDSVPPPADEA